MGRCVQVQMAAGIKEGAEPCLLEWGVAPRRERRQKSVPLPLDQNDVHYLRATFPSFRIFARYLRRFSWRTLPYRRPTAFEHTSSALLYTDSSCIFFYRLGLAAIGLGVVYFTSHPTCRVFWFRETSRRTPLRCTSTCLLTCILSDCPANSRLHLSCAGIRTQPVSVQSATCPPFVDITPQQSVYLSSPSSYPQLIHPPVPITDTPLSDSLSILHGAHQPCE